MLRREFAMLEVGDKVVISQKGAERGIEATVLTINRETGDMQLFSKFFTKHSKHNTYSEEFGGYIKNVNFRFARFSLRKDEVRLQYARSFVWRDLALCKTNTPESYSDILICTEHAVKEGYYDGKNWWVYNEALPKHIYRLVEETPIAWCNLFIESVNTKTWLITRPPKFQPIIMTAYIGTQLKNALVCGIGNYAADRSHPDSVIFKGKMLVRDDTVQIRRWIPIPSAEDVKAILNFHRNLIGEAYLK